MKGGGKKSDGRMEEGRTGSEVGGRRKRVGERAMVRTDERMERRIEEKRRLEG